MTWTQLLSLGLAMVGLLLVVGYAYPPTRPIAKPILKVVTLPFIGLATLAFIILAVLLGKERGDSTASSPAPSPVTPVEPELRAIRTETGERLEALPPVDAPIDDLNEANRRADERLAQAERRAREP